MCQSCRGVRKLEYKTLKEDQNGTGVVKIQGRPVQFIKQGNKIIVKQHLLTAQGEVIGICEKHEGDAYRCKLGVKISLAKAIKRLITKERELSELRLQPIVTQYDSLVEEITQAMPDTTLKRIRPKRSISE